MKPTLKRALSFWIAFCFTITAITASANVVWEEDYFGTQTEYYAGSAKAISASDNDFSDWNGADMVEIDSGKHPENWQMDLSCDEITYHYALAWDKTYLHFYIIIEEPMSALSSARFYYDITPKTFMGTGFAELKYDKGKNNIYVARATRFGKTTNDPELISSIGIHTEEINRVTHIEVSVPWDGLNESSFIPQDGAYIRYNLGVKTKTSGEYLFAQDTSVWGTDNEPWDNASKFLLMYFETGTVEMPVIVPEELETSKIPVSSYREINAALGKPYTGTKSTKDGWTDTGGNLLTEGSFQDLNTISGNYMEGFQGTGADGKQIPDAEEDGTIVKIIDLGSVVKGLYKFQTGSAQVTSQGIIFPNKVKVYASANGYHYQFLNTAKATDYISSDSGGIFKEMQKYTITLTQGVAARYIKIKIVPPDTNYNILALSEITAVYNEADGGSSEPKDAIVSLGAKVNTASKGLRFGAEYNKKEDIEVDQIGMLIYPAFKLGTDILDMEYYYKNPYSEENKSGVILINAVSIASSDFVPGREFKDYDSFVYFVTLLNIPYGQLSTDITAVPFIKYKSGSIIYGIPLVRNYTDVLAASEAIEE